MDIINAIAKVRFNSARPQRVQLSKCPSYFCELLCLEPGQEISGSGRGGYYVIAGKGKLRSSNGPGELEMGNFIAFDDAESHTLINSSEQRLIVLSIT